MMLRNKFLLFVLPCLLAAATPLQAQDYAQARAQIVDLQARYTFAMDFNDPDAYAAVFAEDGVLDWAGGEVVGREAIRKFMQDGVYNLSRNAQAGAWAATTRHFITNQVIEVDGDTARAWTYWFQVNNNAADRSASYGLFGHYEDELARIDGKWLFTRRAIYNEGIPNRNRAGTPNPVTKDR